MYRRTVLAGAATALAATAGCSGPLGPSRAFEADQLSRWSAYRGDRRRSGSLGSPGTRIENPVVQWRTRRSSDDRRHASLLGPVVLLTGDEAAWALDAATGEHLATFDRGRTVSGEVLAVDGDLVIPEQSAVTGLDHDTGERLWTTELGEAPINCYEGACDETPYWVGTPAVGDDRLAVVGPSRPHERAYTLYCLALDGGAVEWSRRLAMPFGRRAVATPVVADGRVVVRSTSGEYVRAFDLADGESVWKTATPPADDRPKRHRFRPLVADGAVVVTRGDGSVVAHDLAEGTERWRCTFESVGGAPNGWSRLAAGDERVYVADRDFLGAIDLSSGEAAWSRVDEGGKWQRPAVVDGTVYASRNYRSNGGATYPNEVSAFDGESGARRWEWTSSVKGTAGDVVVGPGGVYLPFTAGVWRHRDDETEPMPSVGVTCLVDESAADDPSR